MTWTASDQLERQAVLEITRLREEMLAAQKQEKDRLAAQHAARGTLRSGAFLSAVEQDVEKRLLAFGPAVVNASIEIAMLSGAPAGGDLDAWVNQMFEQHFVSAATSFAVALSESRKQQGVPEDGAWDQINSTIFRARRDRDISLGRLKLQGGTEVKPAETKVGSAENDDLLPVLRRRQFDLDVKQHIEKSRASQMPTGLLMLDVDHFKMVNDGHGHQVGDQALISIAEVIRQGVEGKGLAYRYGGEEMAVLVMNHSVEEAAALAERIRRQVEREPRTAKALQLTVSIGVACFPQDADGAEKLIEAADRALYEAKASGRNQTRVSGGAVVQSTVAGGPRPGSAVELAKRIREQKDAEAARLGFLQSEAGVQAARDEIGRLLDTLQQRGKEISEMIGVIVERRDAEMLWMYAAGFTLVVDWHLPYINTTRESGLYVLYHKGRVGPGMYANLEKPSELSRRTYAFDVGPTKERVWRHENSVFTTEKLVDQLVTGLLEHISG